MLLDIGGNNDRLDGFQCEPSLIAPLEELSDGVRVRKPSVLVPNCRREELDEPPCRRVAGVYDQGRQRIESEPGNRADGTGDWFLLHRSRRMARLDRNAVSGSSPLPAAWCIITSFMRQQEGAWQDDIPTDVSL